MAQILDIKVTGSKRAQRIFNRLDTKMKKKIVGGAFRKSARRLRPKMALAAPVDSGRLQDELYVAKVRGGFRRGQVRIGVVMPSREQLGIDPDDKGYYPFSMEYGYTTRDGQYVPPQSYIRKVADERMATEQARMSREIVRAAISEARRK